MCVNNGNMKGVGEHIEQRNLGQFVITLLSFSVIAVKDNSINEPCEDGMCNLCCVVNIDQLN